MIHALYVEIDGVYAGLPDVYCWDKERDARRYPGPSPVVAHPPCQRWGRFAKGAPNKPGEYEIGADDNCFRWALAAVRNWGGVLEHPADSKAWPAFGLVKPKRGAGWVRADDHGGWTCYVEQGNYGHFSRKGTWLYAVGVDLPNLIWMPAPQRLPAYAVERYGYAKARRIGVMVAVGGKNKTKIRNATPVEFRDVLLGMAATVQQRKAA